MTRDPLARRVFLASAPFACQAALATGQETSGRIKVGQIGTAHAHAAGQMKTLRQFDQLFDVVGLVEPERARRRDVERNPAYRGIPLVSESELLDMPGLQVVAVETEVKDLVATATRSVEAGMHIFLDKPAGPSLEAFQALLKRLEQADRVLQMGYMLHYNPAFEFLWQALAGGWLGKVYSIHAEMSKAVSDAQRARLGRYPGGAMFELGGHVIDLIVSILGKPKRTTAHVLHTRGEQDRLADHMLAVLDYPHANAVVRSALCEVGGQHRRQFVVMGETGTMEIRPLEGNRVDFELSVPRGKYGRGRHSIAWDARGRYDGLWLDLARAVRGQIRLPRDAAHHLATHETVLRASGIL